MESSPSGNPSHPPELVANPTISTEMQGMAKDLREYLLLRNPSAKHPLSERVPLTGKDSVWFLEIGPETASLKVNLHDESGKEARELNYYYSPDNDTDPRNGVPYEITDDGEVAVLTEADIPSVQQVSAQIRALPGVSHG